MCVSAGCPFCTAAGLVSWAKAGWPALCAGIAAATATGGLWLCFCFCGVGALIGVGLTMEWELEVAAGGVAAGVMFGTLELGCGWVGRCFSLGYFEPALGLTLVYAGGGVDACIRWKSCSSTLTCKAPPEGACGFCEGCGVCEACDAGLGFWGRLKGGCCCGGVGSDTTSSP